MNTNNSEPLTSAHEQGLGKTPACDGRSGATVLHKSMSAEQAAKIATVAALYGAMTLVVLSVFSGFAWGPVQFRVSEALCVLALFCPEAVVGLTVGCVLANLINISLSATGILGLLDVVFGSLATLIGAWFTWHFRRKPLLALLGPVVANAFIVPAYLPFILAGIGFYTIPFAEISLDTSYVAMYVFGVVATGIGEAAVMYIVGLPLYKALVKAGLGKFLKTNSMA